MSDQLTTSDDSARVGGTAPPVMEGGASAIASLALEGLEARTPHVARSTRRHIPPSEAQEDSGADPEELAFSEDDETDEPEGAREALGDIMHNDVPEGGAIRFVTKEATKEEEEAEKEKPKEKWADRHLVDLAHGVPLVSVQDDAYKIRGQNFVCFSFIEGGAYNALHFGNNALYRGDLIKIRGVFKTRENADAFIKDTIMPSDPHHKVWLAKSFSWMLLDEQDDEESGEEPTGERAERVDAALRGYFENENNRVNGLQRRIDMVRSSNKRRSREVSDFFRAAQARAEREREEDAAARAAIREQGKNGTAAPVVRLDADEFGDVAQSWAVISYIPPEEYNSRHYEHDEGTSRPLIKFRGVFASREEAEQHIRQRIQALDNSIDVSLIPCWTWAGLADDCVADREYMGVDERCDLNALVGEYHQNRNDTIAVTPQQRVADARERQLEFSRRGVAQEHMPFDARMVPPPASATAPMSDDTQAVIRDAATLEEIEEEEEECDALMAKTPPRSLEGPKTDPVLEAEAAKSEVVFMGMRA